MKLSDKTKARIISLRKKGVNIGSIAHYFEINRSTVIRLTRGLCMEHKPFSAADDEFIRSNYRKIPAKEIAAVLGREPGTVHRRANRLGLSLPQVRIKPPDWADRIREMTDRNLSHTEMASALGLSRRYVCQLAKKIGLKSTYPRSDRHRAATAKKTRAQCRAAGVNSLAEVRNQAYEKFAESRGWPRDTRARAVQMLELLFVNGLMSRRQLAEAMGAEWRGARHTKILHSNDKGGSYLATLIERGLVASSPRLLPPGETNRHKTVRFYCLTPAAIAMKAAFLTARKDESNDSKHVEPGLDRGDNQVAGPATAGQGPGRDDQGRRSAKGRRGVPRESEGRSRAERPVLAEDAGS